MATFDTSPTAPFGAITVYRAVSAAESVLDLAWRGWTAYRTRKVLQELTDEQLDDIGLTRAAVRSFRF